MFPFKKKNKEEVNSSDNIKHYNQKLTHDLKENVELLKNIFHYPINQDFIVRELQIRALQKRAVMFFINGMSNEEIIENVILHNLTEDDTTTKNLDGVLEDVVSIKNAKKIAVVDEIKDDLLNGNTIVYIENYNEAISFATTKFEHRSVSKPLRENVIRGAQESFIGSMDVNRSLIRKRLRSENLVTENIVVGQRAKSVVSLLYVDDLVNLQALQIAKKRIKKINVSTVLSVEILEQYIEDKPHSLLPTILYTERPDRANAFLMEGHVVVLMDSSSACLILPATFWSLFQTADDMNSRWIGGIFTRLIRFLAVLTALLTPALYVAITKFHPEMIPTDLLLSIAGTRERVPFPAIIEILFMLLSFELIHEAGVRIPTAVGPTIGIVGALIIGQAAVQANIVSPILVIVIGLTGLSTFAIPENSLNTAVRVYRLVLILISGIFGMYGLTIGMMFMFSYMVTLTSFGVPFFSPLVPYQKSSGDMLFRFTVLKEFFRPFNMKPQDKVRQQKIERRDETDEQ